MGLLDFTQAASNAIAGNVSGPVDLLNWLLSKGGMGSQEPVGGSAWMKRLGLTREVEPGWAGVLGETAGALSPLAGSPVVARALVKAQANAAIPRTLNPQTGAIVYHGSPHKFDKFSSSKIGTGEGAQAYGHGLYLADSPKVAREYAEKLSSAGLARHTLAQNAGQTDAAIAAAEQSVKHYQALIANGGGGDMRRAQGMLTLAQKKLADLQSMKAGTLDEAGNLYKVDLPDEQIAKMLDWDKPLSQQAPEVVDAARKAFPPSYVDGRFVDPFASGKTGRALLDELNAIANKRGGPGMRQAEPALKASGIPGIRYLDGGSRGAGTGTSNYVVFPGGEDFLTILERNGLPTLGLTR